MPEIRPLRTLDERLLHDLITGYTSTARYEVAKVESPEYTRIELQLVPLERPFVKRYTHLDAATVRRYLNIAALGSSLGAFAGERCIGIALAEPQDWNQSLNVHEFHVAEEFQGQGLGRQLMEALIVHARALGMRCIVCETQTTNVPAIMFYCAMGFTLDGIDLSLYTNHDREGGEVAVYMRKVLVE
ncbi:MAG TPA: GNAT family N-acetyltransferase [Ktedonobacterales bacterium]|nr:GNAT family N-acetyltransferase [Ktedonobacterales bacterium]